MNKVRITGAVASKNGITLYLDTGTPLELTKNSHRTKRIMKAITKPLAQKKVVEIDLDEYSAHAQVERKTGGFIRFAIEKVSNFLNFKGETGGEFGAQKIKGDETLVAHVGERKIPGAQALEKQIEYAAFTEDCKGFVKFMERLATVVDDREHTVQELLTFLKRADLPIANDGTIIGYKTLNKAGDENDVFVDCHTQKVRQKLGSRVTMPIDDIDPSRYRHCSTGLHIARRRYLRHYYGDVLVLAKIAPEHVVAVPHGEPDKMRVMSYHIVRVLGSNIAAIVRGDKPMTDNIGAAKALADVIAGDHVGELEEVLISHEKAEQSHRDAKSIETKKNEEVKPFLGAGDNGLADALRDRSDGVSEVDIRALNEDIKEAQVKKPEPKKPTEKVVKVKAARPAKKGRTAAQKKRENAYQAVMNGMSQREAAKQFSVCPKTLRKMIKDRAPKAAE